MSDTELKFREFNESDFELLYSLFSDEQVMRYVLFDAYKSKDAFRPFFESIIQNNRCADERRGYEYAVFTQDDQFVGIGVIEIEIKNAYGGCGEIGYLLMPSFWGKGLATRIASELLRIGFEDLALHRMWAGCHAKNAASEKVMIKIGMRKEAQMRAARFKDGGWHDGLRYAILIDEWEANK